MPLPDIVQRRFAFLPQQVAHGQIEPVVEAWRTQEAVQTLVPQ